MPKFHLAEFKQWLATKPPYSEKIPSQALKEMEEGLADKEGKDLKELEEIISTHSADEGEKGEIKSP